MRETLRDLLDADLAPRAFVLELVRFLDLHDEPEALVRAFIAAGTLLPESPNVNATLAAARALLADPSKARSEAFFEAATQSYPFGPGEGCFAVKELGAGCAPGTGCRSGAGCLAVIAETVGYDETAAVIRRSL